MAEVLIVGGGVVGMGSAMLLTNDGHGVTVLEREGEPPPDGSSGCDGKGDRAPCRLA